MVVGSTQALPHLPLPLPLPYLPPSLSSLLFPSPLSFSLFSLISLTSLPLQTCQSPSGGPSFVVHTRSSPVEDKVRCECHEKVTDNTTRKAKIKLIIACLVALVFMVGEVVGKLWVVPGPLFSFLFPVHIKDCEGWCLFGCRGSMAEHWRLKQEVSWVRLPASAGFFTFLYFPLNPVSSLVTW